MTARVLPAVAAVAYLVAPGHPDLPLNGTPIGVTGLLIVVALVTLTWWSRGQARDERDARRASAILIAALLVKLPLAWIAPASGWLARYYANDGFAGAPERSTDFPALGATRIDREVDFTDTEFPVHFFNEYKHTHGFRREYTDPFSVQWLGHVTIETDTPITVRLAARGRAAVRIDGADTLQVESTTSVAEREAAVSPGAGEHLVEVLYRKPPETEGLVRVSGLPRVSPSAPSDWQRASLVPLTVAGVAVHAVFAATVLWWLVPAVRRAAATSTLADFAAPAVIFALTLQGWWKARHLIGHVWTLTAGDDWFEFESQARDALLNGLILTQGAIVGRGQPYFYYPGYIYFVALVHRIVGESLAGVIVVNFVMLALASVLVYQIARRLFSRRAALFALAWLLLVEQAAFTRHYTVTLLTENLFVFTVAATALGLMLFLSRGRVRDVAWSALAGGVSALTRPSMMLFLPLAALLLTVVEWRRSNLARGAAIGVLFVALWMAAIAPATIRNYVMSGQPVLITSGQARTFIDYNLPAGGRHYRDAFDGTMTSVAGILFQIFLEHPREFLSNLGTKLGFSLGMVHWMGTDIKPHPELLITTVAYLAAIVLVPGARSLPALPVHLFILTHLATLMLSMPSNYGYRLLLPMYLFMPIFAGAAADRARAALSSRRSPLPDRAA